MSGVELDRDTLSAYADGALDAAAAAEVAVALTTSPTARAQLRWIEESRSLLCDAYNDLAAEGAPPALAARLAAIGLDDAPAAAQNVAADAAATGRGGWRRWVRPALTASSLAFLIGLPAGYLLSELRHDEATARAEALQAADRQAITAAVSDALETRLSGNTVDWQVQSSGSRGAVTPIRSFRNGDGRWCREYRLTTLIAGREDVRRGIACRGDGGAWHTEVIALNASS